MSEQEQKAFKLYGKLPAKNHLMKMQKVSQLPMLRSITRSFLSPRTWCSRPDTQDRKYFDSADHYSAGSTGREIPTPQA